MTIRCPHKDCNAKMVIHDAVLSNPNSSTRCPICKKPFKPYEVANVNGALESSFKNPKIDPNISIAETQKTEFLQNPKTAKAWLIIHDEAAPPQTYDLFEGINSCGREPAKNGNEVKIQSSDPYFSRNHFSVEVVSNEQGGGYVLKDCASTNGTYIGTKRLAEFETEIRQVKQNEEIYIEDGALIQGGKTKIYFKVAATTESKEQVADKIHNQKFTKTVIIKI